MEEGMIRPPPVRRGSSKAVLFIVALGSIAAFFLFSRSGRDSEWGGDMGAFSVSDWLADHGIDMPSFGGGGHHR